MQASKTYHFSMPENAPQYPQPNSGQPYYPPQPAYGVHQVQYMPPPINVNVSPQMTQAVSVQIGVRPRHGFFWLMGQLLKWSLLLLFWPFALAWHFREDIGKSMKAHPIGWSWGGVGFGIVSLFAGAWPIGVLLIIGCAVPITQNQIRKAQARRAVKTAEDAAVAARADAQHQAVLADNDYGVFGTNDPRLTHGEPQ